MCCTIFSRPHISPRTHRLSSNANERSTPWHLLEPHNSSARPPCRPACSRTGLPKVSGATFGVRASTSTGGLSRLMPIQDTATDSMSHQPLANYAKIPSSWVRFLRMPNCWPSDWAMTSQPARSLTQPVPIITACGCISVAEPFIYGECPLPIKPLWVALNIY